MSRWAPIVYGRTLRTDKWWRVLPEGVTTRHWAAQTAQDAIAGGAALVRFGGGAGPEQTPRFVLARGVDGTLLGVVCRASALSADMHREENGREVYSFIGWFSGDPHTADLPSFEEFESRFAEWAGGVYEERTRPVWTLHPARFAMQEGLPAPAPWSGADGSGTGLPPAGDLRALPGAVLLHPSADASRLWSEGVGSAPPFTLVTGWQSAGDASLERISHLCADDVAEATSAPRPVPPPKPGPRPLPGASGPAAAPPGTEPRDARWGGGERRAEPPGRPEEREEPGLAAELFDFLKEFFGFGGRPEEHEPRRPGPRPDRYGDPRRGLGGDPREAQRRIDEMHERGPRPSPYGPVVPPPRVEEPPPPPPPVETRLPEREGKKKLFEGLDD